MGKQIAFKDLPSESTEVVIGDNVVGTITLIKEGSVRVNEARKIAEILSRADNDRKRLLADFAIDMFTLAYQRKDPAWTHKDTLECDNLKMGLVQKVSEFLLKEKNEWQEDPYLLRVDGNDGKAIAQKYAEDNFAVLSYPIGTGDDENKTWLVFSKLKDVPSGFKVESNYTGEQPEEGEAEEKTEQSPQPTGVKSTGN